jgi:phosphinothricin acetyltransferase
MSDNSPAADDSTADRPAERPTDRAAVPPRSDVRVRPATAADLTAINDIYNHYVLHSTATYQEDPEPIAGRAAWFDRHGPRHPVTVAVDSAGAVLGWASLSPFHPRSAYRFTVENSVYLRHDARGRGDRHAAAGRPDRPARAIGHQSVIAGIDADQPASVALHRRFGFAQVAHLRQGRVQVRPVAPTWSTCSCVAEGDDVVTERSGRGPEPRRGLGSSYPG